MNLDAMISEQQERWASFEKAFADATPTAIRAWRQHLRAGIQQRKLYRDQVVEYEKDGMHPLLRGLVSDERYRNGLKSFSRLDDALELMADRAPSSDSLMAQPLTLHALNRELIVVGILGAFEETLDIFGPPYTAESTELLGGPHHEHQVFANKVTGHFRFRHMIGHEGGWSYAAAAIWTHFMRRSPGSPPGQGTPGIAQVRPYVPYSYHWINKSYVATAHNHAGFGVFVTSTDLSGGDEQIEQNYPHWIFSDETSWFQKHTNPAFPDPDAGHALSAGNRAPWFTILPGRMYSAAVWCFGECDARGSKLDSASFAGAGINARLPFLVVAQSKN